MNQGYYRKEGSLLWWKDDKVVDGAELSKKLNEWKALAKWTLTQKQRAF